MKKTKNIFQYALTGLALTAALIQFNGAQAQAASRIEVTEIKVAPVFGQQITFSARIQSSIQMIQVSLLFHEAREQIKRVETLQLDADGRTSLVYDVSQNVFPPFSNIVFWYQVTFVDGSIETSDIYSVIYIDDRFPWRNVTVGPVNVHWYDGDDAFAQSALDAAGAGLLQINEIVPVILDAPVDIYVYSSVEDLQGALRLGGEKWTGGHANPELGMAMVAIPPGDLQSIEMETEIPHELAHVMLYRSLGDGYKNLPAWLIEGLASMVEQYANADYAQALTTASDNNLLIPFLDLCDSFPPDTGRAFLAYAQSQSFVRYLRETYGTTGLTTLTRQYADGLNCEIGATRAFSVPLNQLDTHWRETVLGQNTAGVALRNLSPYVTIMVLILLVPLWGAIDMVRTRRKRERASK
ncbi:MAG: peptidase MA family metallohydrolase [Anaerolineales bacterium]|nr:peptidase MA family metallohydrolase [Anaerolineales bacterium]